MHQNHFLMGLKLQPFSNPRRRNMVSLQLQVLWHRHCQNSRVKLNQLTYLINQQHIIKYEKRKIKGQKNTDMCVSPKWVTSTGMQSSIISRISSPILQERKSQIPQRIQMMYNSVTIVPLLHQEYISFGESHLTLLYTKR